MDKKLNHITEDIPDYAIIGSGNIINVNKIGKGVVFGDYNVITTQSPIVEATFGNFNNIEYTTKINDSFFGSNNEITFVEDSIDYCSFGTSATISDYIHVKNSVLDDNAYFGECCTIENTTIYDHATFYYGILYVGMVSVGILPNFAESVEEKTNVYVKPFINF